MKVAITAKDGKLNSQIDPRFGRAVKFIMYNTDDKTFTVCDNVQNLNASQGAGIQAAQTIIDNDAEALITGHCGPKAFKVLLVGDVKVYSGADGTVQENLDKLANGLLKSAEDADVEGHWV